MEKINSLQNKNIFGLDRMRVFAITIILIYHFFPTVLPAGFLGVNVFFVISGFLLTFHATKEIKETKRFSLSQFYIKRYNRIFPGLLLMLTLSVLLVFFVHSDYRVDIGKQVASTFSFSTNWYEIVSGGSYEAQFIKHIFVHTWFLSLEIHFYILWPLIIVLLIKIAKKFGIRKFKSFIFLISISIAILSYLIMYISLFNFKENVNWIYLSDFTRISSFFVGSTIAVIPNKINLRIGNAVALAIYLAILILSFSLNYNSIFTYLFGFIITDILSAILILTYLNFNKKDLKIFEFCSKYSYGIYLFHWPLLVLISSKIEGNIKYLIIILITMIVTYINNNIWEPLFTGKTKFSLKRIGADRFASLAILTSVVILLLLTFVAEASAPKMVSLKKGILVNSINQDIEKINMDYNDLSNAFKDEFKSKETSTNDSSENKNISKYDKELKRILKDKKVTVIGDSVLLGPRKYIMENIPNTFVDSEGFRLLDKGFEVVKNLKDNDKLGDYLVIALGTNAIEDSKKSIEKILDEVPKGTRVILVTPHDNNSAEHKVGVAMKPIAKDSKYITLMDWEAYGKSHPELYSGTDGIHFYGREDTYEAYVNLLKETLIKASKTSGKK